MPDVRLGIIGAEGSSAEWIAALSEEESRATPQHRRAAGGSGAANVILTAVCDRDCDDIGPVAARAGATLEDDDRAMLIQHKLDLVVLATSPAARERLIPLALERGCAVIVEPPPARTAEVARKWIEEFETAGRPIWVLSDWRFDPAMSPCRDSQAALGQAVHAAGQFFAPLPTPMRWQADRVRTGGGVLSCGAYDLLDAMVCALGMPSDVLAVLSRFGRSTSEPYDTEDCATLLLRFADGGAATLAARWGPPPFQNQLYLAGRRRAATIARDRVTLFPAVAAEPLDEPFLERPLNSPASAPAAEIAEPEVMTRDAVSPRRRIIRRMLEAITGSDEAEATSGSTLRDHLPVMAVLEAAYLSARTGESEAMHLILERAGIRE